MPNPEDCPQTMWCATLDDLELSASLEESRTLLVELISMLSSCSNGSLAQEMSVYSMWVVVTQTLCAVTEVRSAVGTMRQKTGTLWGVDSSERIASPEGMFADLAINGILLSWHEIETNFLTCARSWSQGHFAAPLTPLRPMLTGDSGRSPNRTNIHANWVLTKMRLENSVIGMRRMCRETLEVSVPPLKGSPRDPREGFPGSAFRPQPSRPSGLTPNQC